MLLVLVLDTSPSMAMASFALKQFDRYYRDAYQRTAYMPLPTNNNRHHPNHQRPADYRLNVEKMEWRLHQSLLFPDKLRGQAAGCADEAADREVSVQNPFQSSLTCLHAAVYACEQFLERWEKRPSQMAHHKLQVTLWTTTAGLLVPVTDNVRQCIDTLRWIASPANIRHLASSNAPLSRHPAPISWCQLLSQVFEYLHLLRLSQCLDTPGHGWYPCLMKATSILCLTDGGPIFSPASDNSGDINLLPKLDIPLAGPDVPGNKYYNAPFRWDQRIFTLSLHGIAAKDPFCAISRAASPHSSTARRELELMSRVTNGRVFSLASETDILDCLSELSSIDRKFHFYPSREGKCLFPTGVSVIFNVTIPATTDLSSGKDAAPLLRAEPCIINVDKPAPNRGLKAGQPFDRQSVDEWGLFPIPDCFVSRPDAVAFPCQFPIPNIYVQAETSKDWQRMAQSAQIIGKFFFLPPAQPLCHRLLMEPLGTCWLCYASESDMARNVPFGFIRSGSRRDVCLWVLPYNFPYLIRLLETFKRFNDGRPSMEWYASLDKYLASIPAYYHWPLKRALENHVRSRSGRVGLPLPATYDATFTSRAPKGATEQLHRNFREARAELHNRNSSATSRLSVVKTEPSAVVQIGAMNPPATPNVFDIEIADLMSTWKQMQSRIDTEIKSGNSKAKSGIPTIVQKWFGQTKQDKKFAPRTEAQRQLDLHPVHNRLSKDMADMRTRMVEIRYPTVELQLFDEHVKRTCNPYSLYPYAQLQRDLKRDGKLAPIREMVTEDSIDNDNVEDDDTNVSVSDTASENSVGSDSDSSTGEFKRLADCPPLSDDDSVVGSDLELMKKHLPTNPLTDKAPPKHGRVLTRPITDSVRHAFPLSIERVSTCVPVLKSLVCAPFDSAVLSSESMRGILDEAQTSFLKDTQDLPFERNKVEPIIEVKPEPADPNSVTQAIKSSSKRTGGSLATMDDAQKRAKITADPPVLSSAHSTTASIAADIPLRQTVEPESMKQLVAIIKKRSTVAAGELTSSIKALHLTDVAERNLATELVLQAKRFRKNALVAEMEEFIKTL